MITMQLLSITFLLSQKFRNISVQVTAREFGVVFFLVGDFAFLCAGGGAVCVVTVGVAVVIGGGGVGGIELVIVERGSDCG